MILRPLNCYIAVVSKHEHRAARTRRRASRDGEVSVRLADRAGHGLLAHSQCRISSALRFGLRHTSKSPSSYWFKIIFIAEFDTFQLENKARYTHLLTLSRCGCQLYLQRVGKPICCNWRLTIGSSHLLATLLKLISHQNGGHAPTGHSLGWPATACPALPYLR